MEAVVSLPAALQTVAADVAQQAYVAAFTQQAFVAAGLAAVGVILALRLRKA
jgi:hypothetical protein